MEITSIQKDRFCLLVALMCEGSITDDELKELSESPIKGYVSITDPVQVMIIATRLLPVYSEYEIDLTSIKIKRPTSYLIQFECIKTKPLEKRVARHEHILQIPIRRYLNPDLSSENELSAVPISLVEGEENSLRIQAIGPKAISGKAPGYLVSGFVSSDYDDGHPVTAVRIPMQSAAPRLRAANGLTIECLLTMAEDQLQGLQSGAFPYIETGRALSDVRSALFNLRSRTTARIQQNIKNLQIPH